MERPPFNFPNPLGLFGGTKQVGAAAAGGAFIAFNSQYCNFNSSPDKRRGGLSLRCRSSLRKCFAIGAGCGGQTQKRHCHCGSHQGLALSQRHGVSSCVQHCSREFQQTILLLLLPVTMCTSMRMAMLLATTRFYRGAQSETIATRLCSVCCPQAPSVTRAAAAMATAMPFR